MVGVFKRSLSFPTKINPSRPSKPPISHHIRSISLPCRSHPLISQLQDDISELKSWSSKPDSRTSVWLCDGLSRLRDIHDSLDEILQLPQTQDSLRRRPLWVENLLENFLRFVDVYGIFQTSVISLKEDHFAAQVALRKRDESKVVNYVKARKRIAKDMSKLASTIKCLGRYSVEGTDMVTAELAGVIGEAVEVTVAVTLALLNGVTASFEARKSTWMGLRLAKKAKKGARVDESIEEFKQVGVESLWGLRKKEGEEVRNVVKRMQDLEKCISDVESCSERVFRSLINAKVSLLNSLTQ